MATKQTYSDKLRDPRWQKKRLEILNRDSWKCTKCDNGTKTLHVHHIIYKGDPWEVDEKHLRTLCEDCHTAERNYSAEPMLEFVRNAGISESELVEILSAIGWRVNESDDKPVEVKKIIESIYPGFKNHWVNNI